MYAFGKQIIFVLKKWKPCFQFLLSDDYSDNDCDSESSYIWCSTTDLSVSFPANTNV